MEKDTRLRVAETSSTLVGRGLAAIDPKVMESLGLSPGDVIEVTGKGKKSHAVVWTGYPEDYGRGLVRIDGYTRNNLGVGIDDTVSIAPADAKEAQEVVLAPTEQLSVEGLEEAFPELLENRVMTKGDSLPFSIMGVGKKIDFVVDSTSPSGPVVVTLETTFRLGTMHKPLNTGVPRITYEDLGGLTKEIQKIREMIELPLRHPEIFERVGIEAPKGVLLYGPPGTGKTLLAKAVANETNSNFYSIAGPEIMGKHYGESEERLRGIFKEAQEHAPSIIFIDEIDSIAPKREEVSGELEKRIVSQLLTLMDGLESRGKVVVIAATNRPDALDPALRRPGRFDREIEIGIPDVKSRLEILQIHTRGMPMESDVKLEEMARVTHGFVGADLQALAREAAILAVRRVIPEISMDETKVPAKTLNKIKVKMQDFQDALRDVQPSAMREVLVQAPNVKWEDIGGLASVKEELTEAVEWPLKYGKLFSKGDVKPPKGILLYGPPGTGKTLIAKAVANESEANFISIKGPELISKWVGESEKGVREVFRKARAAAPCVIFFDEVDAIAPRRKSGESDSQVTERVVSQLLTEMDGLEELKGVVVLGATNRPDIIDEALLRPGRFDKLLRIPPPDNEGRIEILKIHTKKKPLAKDVDIAKLAEMTEGYTGAELAAAANAASLAAIKNFIKAHGKSAEDDPADLTVTMHDFEEAITETKRKPSPEPGRVRPELG
ncbi:MAG TPA: CDC48 family AAA ATPase [Nitrososphaerales archaeon]|nr:CDC48 family AAA ATPase [Nitrososphaerales archaeon]